MGKKEILFRQEHGTFNKPNILIDIWKNTSLSTRSLRVYDTCLRILLNQNREEYQKNKIKTSVSAIARAMRTSKREDIVGILDVLNKTSFKFNNTIENREYKYHTTLISGFAIEKKGKDSLEIEFNSHLTGEVLKNLMPYTKIDLDEINRLTKMYSLPLYQLFRWKLADYPIQSQNYTEDRLRDFLQLDDLYTDIKDFNRNVIKNSINDINKHTSLTVILLKVERAKNQKPRKYKFQILQKKDKTVLPLKRFKVAIIEMAKDDIRIERKRRQFEYVLTFKSITGKYIDENHFLWAHKGSLKTAKTEIGISLWEELYLEYKNNPKTFLFDYLGMKVTELLEYEKRGID